jgi:hypothetical protein
MLIRLAVHSGRGRCLVNPTGFQFDRPDVCDCD